MLHYILCQNIESEEYALAITSVVLRSFLIIDRAKDNAPSFAHKQLVHVKLNCITQLESIYAMCCLLAHVRLNINIMF